MAPPRHNHHHNSHHHHTGPGGSPFPPLGVAAANAAISSSNLNSTSAFSSSNGSSNNDALIAADEASSGLPAAPNKVDASQAQACRLQDAYWSDEEVSAAEHGDDSKQLRTAAVDFARLFFHYPFADWLSTSPLPFIFLLVSPSPHRPLTTLPTPLHLRRPIEFLALIFLLPTIASHRRTWTVLCAWRRLTFPMRTSSLAHAATRCVYVRR